MTIIQPHMPHDIIIQPYMSSLVTKTDLDDVKSEPDDITQLQISGQEIGCHLDDVKSEPDDTINQQSQMSSQETDCLLDIKSESDNSATNPQIAAEFNCTPDVHSREKPYHCLVCLQRFTRKCTLNKHMKNRH